LQAPALEAGGEQFASIAEIAAAYVTVIRGHAASGPYLLGGWSFGGIVAWEMAQQLRAEGADVPVLVLLDSYAPEHFVADDAEMMVRFSFDFVASLGKYEHVVTRNDLLAAPPERWPSMVLDAGAKAGLIPAGLVDPERFAKLHLVYRAHVRAAQGYYPKPYGGVVLNIMARESTVYRSDGVWTRFAPESTVSTRIPGDHDSCLRPPNITALAEAWQSILKQVEAK
jgi:thioesterase domain-containing protein